MPHYHICHIKTAVTLKLLTLVRCRECNSQILDGYASAELVECCEGRWLVEEQCHDLQTHTFAAFALLLGTPPKRRYDTIPPSGLCRGTHTHDPIGLFQAQTRCEKRLNRFAHLYEIRVRSFVRQSKKFHQQQDLQKW